MKKEQGLKYGPFFLCVAFVNVVTCENPPCPPFSEVRTFQKERGWGLNKLQG